jgi:hypothetical protein
MTNHPEDEDEDDIVFYAKKTKFTVTFVNRAAFQTIIQAWRSSVWFLVRDKRLGRAAL